MLESSASFPFSKLKGFKIGQINIASLVKHHDELLVYMQSKSLDVLTVNETRLDISVLDCEVETPGYDIVRLDRNRNGGGVAIFIRENISYIVRQDLVIDALELLCIEVRKQKSKPFLIATWYRPPNSSNDLFQKFEHFLKLVDYENIEIIIAGDLNCNFLESPKGQVTHKLLDLMNTYQLQQHIEKPTRVTPTTSSLIDVIFTYVGDNKTLETGIIPLGISDHNLVYICRKISFPKELPKFVLTRQYKRYNVNAFNHDLNEIFNLYSPVSNDPNELWGDFKHKFLSIAGKHAPVKQRRVKRESKPWITSEIKHLIYHRDYLKRQEAIRLRSVYYETAYKKCKNKITNLIRTSKENYFKAKLSDSKNSKESWQFINELLNKNSKTSQIREINFDGKTVTKDEEIAAGFNEYFSTIGSMLSKAIKDCDTDPLVISAIDLLPLKVFRTGWN